MRTAGIISEYNPFHRGHAWQICELRRRLGAETAVVCAMSGSFVQRGDFAVMRTHARAEAAVRGGADLVLELPLPWAIASAEGFAAGGVGVLAATGAVDTLVFGSECGDTETLKAVTAALESESFAAYLRQGLQEGVSFAAAREAAARKLLGEKAAVLAQPNDILGVEYCKAIARQAAALMPLALPRRGVGHDGGAAEGFASASHIRELLINGACADEFLTPESAAICARERAAGRAPVTMANAERAILARLRAMREEDFAPFDGGGEGLYHRFYDAARDDDRRHPRRGEVQALRLRAAAAAAARRLPRRHARGYPAARALPARAGVQRARARGAPMHENDRRRARPHEERGRAAAGRGRAAALCSDRLRRGAIRPRLSRPRRGEARQRMDDRPGHSVTSPLFQKGDTA